MDNYMCTYCGAVDDMDTQYEYRGEFWGTPAYEAITVCACCGRDDFEKINLTEQCDRCRNVKVKDHLFYKCEYGIRCGEYKNECPDFEDANLLEPLYGKEVF